MGNIIGEVAVLNACISNCAQDLGVYVEANNVTYKKHFINQPLTDEEVEEFWKWYKDKPRTMNELVDIVKKIIANQFYELEEKIYRTVEISMISIDAPKTGIMSDLDYIKKLKKEYRKPYYFKYLVGKDISHGQLDYYNNSIIESYTRWNEVQSDGWNGIISRCEYYKNILAGKIVVSLWNYLKLQICLIQMKKIYKVY